jgi:lipopolysaccharide biosynthesis glycosyltransferase
MNRSAIVTLNIGNREEALLSKPFFHLYCRRYDLDFIVIHEKKLKINPNRRKPRLGIHLEKFQLAELLPYYDRIAYVDSDILIHPNAPDIFSQVDEQAIGCVFEDIGEEAWKRQEEWDKVQAMLGKLAGSHHYFNAGVVVFSKCHQHLFDLKLGIPGGRWPDQTFLNYHARKLALRIEELPVKFNFLPIFPDWQDSTLRLKQYFVHYAGRKNKPIMRADALLFRQAWGF